MSAVAIPAVPATASGGASASAGSASDVPSNGGELAAIKAFLREAGLTEEELEGDRSEVRGCLKALIRRARR